MRSLALIFALPQRLAARLCPDKHLAEFALN
jgi:hypothetical protein